jgi:hypothetical protein
VREARGVSTVSLFGFCYFIFGEVIAFFGLSLPFLVFRLIPF